MGFLSESFDKMINISHPIVGKVLSKIKEGYEEVIGSVAESLAIQIQMMQQEVINANEQLQFSEDKNNKL